MSAPEEAPEDRIATAVLLEYGKTPIEVENALDRLSRSWKINRVPATSDTCGVFRRVRVPALILYNSAGEETLSAVGDLEIIRLLDTLEG